MFNVLKKKPSAEERIAALEKRLASLEKQNEKLEATAAAIEESHQKKLDMYAKEEARRAKQLAAAKRKADKLAREKKRAAVAARKKAKYIPVVMEATGWDWATVEEKMERAMEVAGSSYEHYAIFRFWELSEEEQMTYFTKRDAKALRKKYNTNREILQTLMNKDLCCKKLEPFLGRPWASTDTMNKEDFCSKFANETKLIYKPRASSGGHGIQIIEVGDTPIEEIYAQLRAMPAGVVEGYLKQHPEMQRLSRNSVNTIRIVTICTKDDIPGVEKDKVHFLYAGVRMGQGSSYVDNLHSGGMMAALNVETGVVETGGVDHTNTMHYVHPDTGTEIVGFKVPYFNELKQMIEKASIDLPGYFGWDVAITETGPVIVEVNTSPGADGLQTPYVPQKKGMRYVIEKYL